MQYPCWTIRENNTSNDMFRDVQQTIIMAIWIDDDKRESDCNINKKTWITCAWWNRTTRCPTAIYLTNEMHGFFLLIHVIVIFSPRTMVPRGLRWRRAWSHNAHRICRSNVIVRVRVNEATRWRPKGVTCCGNGQEPNTEHAHIRTLLDR